MASEVFLRNAVPSAATDRFDGRTGYPRSDDDPCGTGDPTLLNADGMPQSVEHCGRCHLDCTQVFPLAEQVERSEVQLMGRDDYVRTLVDFLELLPPSMIVDRVSGDAPGDYFLGPAWCLDKSAVLKAVQDEFESRDSWQGKNYIASQ